MIFGNYSPLIAVLFPLVGAILIILLGEHVNRKVRETFTFVAAVCAAVTVYSMIPGALAGTEYQVIAWEIVEGVELKFKADAAGMVFGCVASTLWIVTSVYSIGYMKAEHETQLTGYFAAFATCIGAAIGISFAANLLTFFICFEMLTIATYPLVTHNRDEEAKKSGRKYLAYTLISGQIFFACIVTVYVKYGTMDFVPGGFITPFSMPAGTMCILFILMLGAGLVKSGVMPLQNWLPSAMVAPTPVSALLHAVAVVKAGVFCILRVTCYVFGPFAAAWCNGAQIISWFAVGTIIISSLIALGKDGLKARLAFSTIGQLSYIVLGIMILSQISITGAIYHIVAHAFLKITLFMCAGAIIATTGLHNISEMGGLGKRMPITMTCFCLSSFGIAGLPLFAGFISKYNIIMGAFEQGQLLFVATLICAALLALGYLMPVVYTAFRKPITEPVLKEGGEPNKIMLIPIMITCALGIIFGCFPNFALHLFDFAGMAAEQIENGFNDIVKLFVDTVAKGGVL